MQGISNYDNYIAVRKHHFSVRTQRATQRAAQLHRIYRTCSWIATIAIVLGVLGLLAGLGV